jgi:hypothetical protein
VPVTDTKDIRTTHNVRTKHVRAIGLRRDVSSEVMLGGRKAAT